MGVSHGLEGDIELAVLDKINDLPVGSDPNKRSVRGVVRSLLTGGRQNCILNPSPYMGIMPLPNALVAIYRKQGWFSKLIIPLADLVQDNDRTVDQRLSELTEEPTGNIMSLDPGECYFGRFGRIFMDKNGSVNMFTSQRSQSVNLDAVTKRIDIASNNFDLKTHGQTISIHTTPSIPVGPTATFGDTLRIEKNVMTPEIPRVIPGASLAVPTNISRIEIDAAGGITMGASKVGLAYTAKLDLSPLDSPNYVRLMNTGASLIFTALKEIELETTPCSLVMKPATSFVSLTNNVCYLSITGGNLSMSSGASTVIDSKTSMQLLSSTTTSISATTSISITAPTVTINGSLSVAGGAPTVMTGTSVHTGKSTFNGIIEMNGAISMNGALSSVGVPTVMLLTGVSTKGLIPVTVNGVIVGSIPVI
jgi:hypothetical protein